MNFLMENIKNKSEARKFGIDFQYWISQQRISYGECFYFQNFLTKLAKKFGLVKEFKENAII